MVRAEGDSGTADAKDDQQESQSSPPPPPRVLTPDELKVANGVDSENLYLAIFGKVYDVKAGNDYYGTDGPYHVFVGRDAPVPFVTGNFTGDEAAKPWDSLEPKQYGGLLSWIDFYEKEDKYPCIGVVQGIFYDADGQPTAENSRVQEAMQEARVEMKKREEERQRRLAERKKKRQQQRQQPQQMATSSEL